MRAEAISLTTPLKPRMASGWLVDLLALTASYPSSLRPHE